VERGEEGGEEEEGGEREEGKIPQIFNVDLASRRIKG
jgi:hypothetical protein